MEKTQEYKDAIRELSLQAAEGKLFISSLDYRIDELASKFGCSSPVIIQDIVHAYAAFAIQNYKDDAASDAQFNSSRGCYEESGYSV